MKKLIPIIILLPILVVGSYLVWQDKQADDSNTETVADEHDDVHLHAGFNLYVDNELIDLSLPQYMKLGTCSVNHDEIKDDPIAEQLEKAHLHDKIGDVVHVHREGAVWGDLFLNIEYEITDATGYVNGELVESILDYEISQGDRVLILVGENDNIEDKLQNLPSLDWIEEIGERSESCGT